MIRSLLLSGLVLLTLAAAPPAMAADKLSTPLPVPAAQARSYAAEANRLGPQEQVRIETRAFYENAAVLTVAAGAGAAVAVVAGGGLATIMIVGGAIGLVYYTSGN